MAPDLQIRPLGPADAAAFQALRLDGLERHPGGFGSSLEEEAGLPLDAVAARLAPRPPNLVLGAFLGDRLVGLLGLELKAKLKERHKAGLWGMYVHPEARGRGIARALIDRAVAHARATPEIEILQLVVAQENQAARTLYEATGFALYGLERRSLRLADGRYLDDELRALDLTRA